MMKAGAITDTVARPKQVSCDRGDQLVPGHVVDQCPAYALLGRHMITLLRTADWSLSVPLLV